MNVEDEALRQDLRQEEMILYRWTEITNEKIRIECNNATFLHKLDQILQAIDTQDPEKSADQLTDLVQNVLKKTCKIRNTKKNKTKKNFPINSWFDEECKIMKRQVRSLAKEVYKQPTIDKRKEYWSLKTVYKKLIKRKKAEAIKDLHIHLEQVKKKTQKNFGK